MDTYVHDNMYKFMCCFYNSCYYFFIRFLIKNWKLLLINFLVSIQVFCVCRISVGGIKLLQGQITSSFRSLRCASANPIDFATVGWNTQPAGRRGTTTNAYLICYLGIPWDFSRMSGWLYPGTRLRLQHASLPLIVAVLKGLHRSCEGNSVNYVCGFGQWSWLAGCFMCVRSRSSFKNYSE